MTTPHADPIAAQHPPSTATQAHNVRLWDGHTPGHYEVWYLTANHRASRTGYWIRYTMDAPFHGHGAPHAQLWFAHFDRNDPSRTFAIHRTFPIEDMVCRAHPFRVSLGDAQLTHHSASGILAGDGHRARWDLRWLPAATTHHHLPRALYLRGGLADTCVLTPNLDVPLRGVVEVDGVTHAFAGDPAGQTHLWGRKHAHAWAWGHCNAFNDRRGAALEVLTVRLARRGRVLPALTLLALHLDGHIHRFNGLHHTLLTSADMGTAYYRFAACGARTRIEGHYTCRPEDMVTACYEDPDGERAYCANTEVADLRVTVWRRHGLLGRWHEHARLIAPSTGHFEVGGRQRDEAIVKLHVTV